MKTHKLIKQLRAKGLDAHPLNLPFQYIPEDQKYMTINRMKTPFERNFSPRMKEKQKRQDRYYVLLALGLCVIIIVAGICGLLD